jgi:hypothetical protein
MRQVIVTAQCRICRHPDREEIEQEYREWFKASDIARRYRLDDSALHRHLRAVGLIKGSRENLRIILDRIIGPGPKDPLPETKLSAPFAPKRASQTTISGSSRPKESFICTKRRSKPKFKKE